MKKHWQQLIDKFSNAALTQVEQDEFNLLYTTEPLFKEQADFIKDLKIVAATQDQNDFKELLASIETKSSKPTDKNSYKKLWLTAVAVAAILVTVISIYKFTAASDSPEQLYATYFTPHANTLVPIERSATTLTAVDKAFAAYENKNFNQAIRLFNEVDEVASPDVVFFKASAYMATEQFNEAIPILTDYAKKNGKYATYTHWYLALCYLKTDELQKTKTELTIIVKNGYFPTKKAAALLSALE